MSVDHPDVTVPSLDDLLQRCRAASTEEPSRQYARALELGEAARSAGSDWHTAVAGDIALTALLVLDRYQEARDAGIVAIAAADRTDDPALSITLRRGVTVACCQMDDAPAALPWATEGVRLARRHVGTVGRAGVSQALSGLAIVTEEVGNSPRAIELMDQADDVVVDEPSDDEVDDVRFGVCLNLAVLLENAAVRAQRNGDPDQTAELAEQGLAAIARAESWRSVTRPHQEWFCVEHAATLERLAGRPQASLEWVERLRELSVEMPGMRHADLVAAIAETNALLDLERIEEAVAIDDGVLSRAEVPQDDLFYTDLVETRVAVGRAIGAFERALDLLDALRRHERRKARARMEARFRTVVHDAEIEQARFEALQLRERAADLEQLVDTATMAALTDPLTGLGNRRALDRRLGEWLADGRRRPLAVAVIDLDHFKEVNDRFGHPVGDAVLCATADLLVAATRDDDLVVRSGGEEFVILLVDVGPQLAVDVCGRLRRSLAEHDWSTIDGLERGITGSVGLTIATDGDDIETLLRRADLAMYEAKQGGRDRVAADLPGAA